MLNFRPKGFIFMLSGFKPDSKYSLNMLSHGLMCRNFSILEIYFPEKNGFHWYFWWGGGRFNSKLTN